MRKILVIAALACVLPTEARGKGPEDGDIVWFVSGGGGTRVSDDAGQLGTLALGAGLPTTHATTADLSVRITFGDTDREDVSLGEFFGGIGASILPVHSRGYVRGAVGFSAVEKFLKHREGEEVPEEDVLERRIGAGLVLQAGFVLLPFSRDEVGNGGITLGVTVTPTYYLNEDYERTGDWRGSLLVEAGVVSW